jgi:hypothetical protein
MSAPSDPSGAVLGLDVGWSARAATTGVCVMWWDAGTVQWTCANATAEEASRAAAIARVFGDRPRVVSAVAIDGPLRPGLVVDCATCRGAERLLSRGDFRRRGKPGPTNAPVGCRLHQEATALAHLARRLLTIAPASCAAAVGDEAIVEAFPNLFLGVLHDEAGYPTPAAARRRWTDLLYARLRRRGRCQRLLATLLPGRAVRGDWGLDDDHEKIAALACALTALGVAVGRFVAVGADDGAVVLPRAEAWGGDRAGHGAWAARALGASARSLARDGYKPRLERDGHRWEPA